MIVLSGALRHQRDGIARSLSTLTLSPPQTDVARDTREPLGGPVAVPQLATAPPGLVERLLHKIFRRVSVMDERCAQPYEPRPLVNQRILQGGGGRRRGR